MSKKITVSEKVYEELLQIKMSFKEERQPYIDGGYPQVELDNIVPRATFDSVIYHLISELESVKHKFENIHCINCCSCDICMDAREAQIEWEAEQRWLERHPEE
ncbi:hypothetical protein HPT25_01660 [Bacillus sp. BRMEA1]|uniref:hypothetical protein n=1 Tax=Neobacillus endophyticus TaxID=2738405 RepID=UPI0015665F3F|nr:hypothetical protein [Neobacillus endophyticus]NRD76214.1 hypothetical protein [Neobacillus endophyticus]